MEEVTTMANSLVVNLLNFLLVSLNSLANPTMVKISFPLHSLNQSLNFNEVKDLFVRSVVRMVTLLWIITIGWILHIKGDTFQLSLHQWLQVQWLQTLALIQTKISSLTIVLLITLHQTCLSSLFINNLQLVRLSQWTMGKNYLSLILVMVSFSLHFTISILITFLGYYRLLQTYFQWIKFFYKIMPFVILMSINSQFRIYLRGKGKVLYKGLSKDGVYPIPPKYYYLSS